MALFDTTWYCNAGDQSTTGYYALAKWVANTSYAAGTIIRPKTAPAVGSERAYVCIVAGTSANPTEPTWTFTRGVKVTDGATVIWQECTGAAAVNGDATNTPTWTASAVYTLGQIIKRVNGASYWICSTAGTAGGSEPAWANDNAGTTRSDNTVTWTCLGVVGNFSAWGVPFARLASACAATWFAVGNTVYIGDNHAESQTTIISIGPTCSVSTIGKILCVNHSGSMPPVAADLTTGATVSVSGTANFTLLPAVAGGLYVYGLTIKDAVGQSSTQTLTLNSGSGSYLIFDNCSFQQASTGAGALIVFGGSTAGNIVFNNCTVKFANVGQSISATYIQFLWQNTGQVLVSGSSVPTTFMNITSSTGLILLEALDLSQLTGNFIGSSSFSSVGIVHVKDCKLNATGAVVTPTDPASVFQVTRSDSAGTSYLSSRYMYEGTETTETSITRVGGAVDPSGQAQSRKIVSTANTQFARPFRAEPLAIWNSTIAGSVTVTIYGTINAGAIPNNDELWVDLEYLGTASFPLGNIITSAKATILTAAGTTGVNANISTDTSTWNGGGSGGGWSPFKVQFLLDTTHNPQPQLSGFIMARVKVGKATTTYYIDPQITLS